MMDPIVKSYEKEIADLKAELHKWKVLGWEAEIALARVKVHNDENNYLNVGMVLAINTALVKLRAALVGKGAVT